MRQMKLNRTIIILTVLLAGCPDRDIPSSTEEDPPSPPAFTVIRGNVQGTISAAASPYQVTGNLIIDSTVSLVIEAGVRMYFEDSTGIIVRGRLDCEGTMSAPVTFSSFRNTWKGIQIIDSPLMSLLEFIVLENVDVTNDSAFSRNGALEIADAPATVKNSILRDNKSLNGGAIHLERAQAIVSNNIIMDNFALAFGGAVVSSSSSCNFVNNTLFRNATANFGGGIVIINPVSEIIENNIFFMNTGQTGDPRIALLQADSNRVSIQYNFLQVGALDPLFTSQTDFHLSPLSPCINAGNPAAQHNDPNGTRNDQGAYGGPFGDW